MSRLLNVLIFTGKPNESLSSRCHRQRDHWFFGKLRIVIDAMAVCLGDPGHCARSFENDVIHAALLVGAHRIEKSGD